MPLEIEKRFLVQSQQWRDLIKDSQEIRQGYFSTNFNEWVTRVRIVNNQKAMITLKRSLKKMVNHEFEYQIPIKEAEAIWDLITVKLTKRRYFLKKTPGLWIVDCFKGNNAPLMIAEVELETTEESVLKPSWSSDELTGLNKWSNAGLAKTPIALWTDLEREKFKLN